MGDTDGKDSAITACRPRLAGVPRRGVWNGGPIVPSARAPTFRIDRADFGRAFVGDVVDHCIRAGIEPEFDTEAFFSDEVERSDFGPDETSDPGIRQ